MAAEQFSALVVNPLSFLGSQQQPHGYYRSKLFIAPFTTNPLVAAAGPLLSLVERLSITPCLPPINTIRDNIQHELCAFHSRLNSKAYTEELDAIAHYLLCATIDELLRKSYLRLYGRVAEFHPFTPFFHDEIGPERRFFDLLLYMKARPNQYLDLLELAYYCLIAGFEGEQHQRIEGRQVLDDLIEELYQLIQQHRVNKPYRLFHEQEQLPNNFPKNYKPIVAVATLALSILCASYFMSHQLLKSQAKSLQFGHTVMAKLDD